MSKGYQPKPQAMPTPPGPRQAINPAAGEVRKPVVTVRVTNKGYAMALRAYVAYALPEGLHYLYAEAPTGEHVPDAARAVIAERQRQICAEGFDAARDDLYTQHELADAAACYASRFTLQNVPGVPEIWPWPAAWWKPTTYRQDLLKAGALILAELERLDRLVGKPQRNGAES